MTVGLASKNLAKSGGKAVLNETWVRPADWLPMPTITPGEQRYNILFAVWNGSSNYIRLGPAGTDYTIDWGDGSALENFASGAAASHIFSWAGALGAVTTLGYKTAMVQIYPQGAGVFTGFTGDAKHASAPANYNSGMLDFECSAPGSTLPILRDSASTQKNYLLQHFKTYSAHTTASWNNAFSGLSSLRLVEGLELSTPTSLISAFQNCSSLIRGPEMNTTSVSSFSSTFNSCLRMVSVPDYDYSAATDMSLMYSACYALRSLGVMNTGNATLFIQTFQNCYSLTGIASLDTTKATSLAYAWDNCRSMITWPTLNTPANLSLFATFRGCMAQATAPAMNTSLVTTMDQTFSGNLSLNSVPMYDTSKVTIMTSVLGGCVSLRTAPSWDTSKVTNMASALSGCLSLQTCPAWDLTMCNNTTNMFTGCSGLVTIASLTNTSAIATASSMFTNCIMLQVLSINLSGVAIIGAPFTGTTMLRSVILTGLTRGVSVATNLLEAAALDALYTSLGTAAGAQVINVTGNPGTTSDNPTIATGKGWTVTGS